VKTLTSMRCGGAGSEFRGLDRRVGASRSQSASGVSHSNCDSRCSHGLFDLADGVCAEVKDARGEHCVSVRLDDRLGEVLQGSCSPARDDRDVELPGDRTRQRDIEAILRAVAVHAGQHDLTRTKALDLTRPFHNVELGVDATAVDEDFPAVAPAGDPASVDGDHDAL